MTAFMWEPKSDLETPEQYLRRVLEALAASAFKPQDGEAIRAIAKDADLTMLSRTVAQPLHDLGRSSNRDLRQKVKALNAAIVRGEFTPAKDDPDNVERRVARMRSGAGLG